MWQHPTNNITHLHMLVVVWLSRVTWVLKLLLLEIVVEKKKGIGREGGKGRKEWKGGRGKKKGCSKGVFLIFLFAKHHFFFFLVPKLFNILKTTNIRPTKNEINITKKTLNLQTKFLTQILKINFFYNNKISLQKKWTKNYKP